MENLNDSAIQLIRLLRVSQLFYGKLTVQNIVATVLSPFRNRTVPYPNLIVFKMNHGCGAVTLRYGCGTVTQRYGTVAVLLHYGTVVVLLHYGTVAAQLHYCTVAVLLHYGVVRLRYKHAQPRNHSLFTQMSNSWSDH